MKVREYQNQTQHIFLPREEFFGGPGSSGELRGGKFTPENVFFEIWGVENIVFSYFGAFEGPSCAPSDSREKVSMCHFKEIEKEN